MYTIKRAAELVGVSAATLRAWERRYGIVTPHRSEGGYRVYDEDAVGVLRGMAELVADGWAPSQAAAEVVQRSSDDAAGRSDAGAVPPAFHEAVPARPDVVQDLVEGAAGMDAQRIATALDQLFALGTYEAVVDAHLLAAAKSLGEAWESDRVSVAGEHLAANAMMRRLSAAFEAAASYAAGARVVVGLPPGARHEIGALAFAVAARRRGLRIDYLGADLPSSDWAKAVLDPETAAVVLAIPCDDDVPAAARVIETVRAARPDILIAVGGAQQDAASAEARRLGHRVAAAAQQLAVELDGSH